MGKRARGHFSAPPMYRFTPGIVSHGETMVIARQTFVVPDETPRPQGRRTMTVGRKSYSWSTAADVSPLNGGLVTDSLSDEDDGSAPMPVMLDNGTTGYVISPDNGRSWEVLRTTEMGDDPLPKIASGPPVKVKAPRVPRQKSASSRPTGELSDRDVAVRQYLTAQGLSGDVLKITPAIRSAALEAIEAQRQLSDYVGAP